VREVAVLLAAAIALVFSPYLASLTITAPDRDLRSWWRPRITTRRRYAVTATIGVLLAALAGAAAGLGAVLPAYLALAGIGAVLAVVDAEHHRLPNRLLSVLTVAGVALLTAAAGVDDRWHSLGRAALAALAVGAFFYLLALASPRSVGLGDVKLAALLAGFLTWHSWLTAFAGLAGGFLTAGIAALALLAAGRVTRSTHLPLGPFLIGAALLAAALHP
jgi:leader peptidase (prepilin peptidase)/N-methyltransferase